MHQQNHTSSIDLCVVTGFSSPEQWKSIRLLTIFAKWLFEGVNCWSVTSSECVYCQVSAPRNWMVGFVPRRSVSVSAAGGGVSTIWTPRVIETWLILSESLLAIYTLILNGMWEWIRIHALWIMVWLVLVQCAQRCRAYVFTRHIHLEWFVLFIHRKPSPTSVLSIETFWARGQNVFKVNDFSSRQTNLPHHTKLHISSDGFVAFCVRSLNLS